MRFGRCVYRGKNMKDKQDAILLLQELCEALKKAGEMWEEAFSSLEKQEAA